MGLIVLVQNARLWIPAHSSVSHFVNSEARSSHFRKDGDVCSARRSKHFGGLRSEEHTSELQSHSFISYAVFCLKKKNTTQIFSSTATPARRPSLHASRLSC